MEVAYVCLGIKPGLRKEVITQLKKIPGVKEARIVIGVFDGVARIEAETVKELEAIYLNEVEKIPNLVSARLYLVACPRTRK